MPENSGLRKRVLEGWEAAPESLRELPGIPPAGPGSNGALRSSPPVIQQPGSPRPVTRAVYSREFRSLSVFCKVLVVEISDTHYSVGKREVEISEAPTQLFGELPLRNPPAGGGRNKPLWPRPCIILHPGGPPTSDSSAGLEGFRMCWCLFCSLSMSFSVNQLLW